MMYSPPTLFRADVREIAHGLIIYMFCGQSFIVSESEIKAISYIMITMGFTLCGMFVYICVYAGECIWYNESTTLVCCVMRCLRKP